MQENKTNSNHNAIETFLVLISVLCFFLCFVNPLMVLVPVLAALGAVLGYRISPKMRARWEALPVSNVPRLVKRVTLFGICFLGLSLFGFFATKKLDAWLEQHIPKRQSMSQPSTNSFLSSAVRGV